MDDSKKKKINSGKDKLVEYQKRKSRSKAVKKLTEESTDKVMDSGDDNSLSQDSDFTFSISVTPPPLPDDSAQLKSIEQHNIDVEKSISECISINSSDNSENDRSLNEIELKHDELKTDNKMDELNSGAGGDFDKDSCSEKRRRIQDTLDDILRNENVDILMCSSDKLSDQSYTKIQDLQQLLIDKDTIIKTLTTELEEIRAQYSHLSTFSSNTSTTEYKMLAEEYLKRDLESIKQKVELEKQDEVDKIRISYEDKVEEIMKNNDSVLKELELKYVEEIENLKKQIESFNKTENINKSESNSCSEKEYNEIVLSYESRLKQQIKMAKQDLYAALESQIQYLLENNGEIIDDCPTEFYQLRDMFTKKFQEEIDTLKAEHNKEISKLKDDHERFIVRAAERQQRRSLDLESSTTKLIDDRNDMKKIWIETINELIKYFSKCEDEVNNTIIGELFKDEDNDTFETSTDVIDLNESQLRKLKRIHFTPNLSNIVRLLDESTLDLQNISTLDLQNELSVCLERLRNDAVELLAITANFKPSIVNKSLDDSKRLSITSADHVDQLKMKLNSEVKLRSELNEQLAETTKLVQSLQLERDNLELQLSDLIDKQKSMDDDLEKAQRKIVELISNEDVHSGHRKRDEIVSEGYGQSDLPALTVLESPRETFTQALEQARLVLDEAGDGTDQTEMLAVIESLCRSGLRTLEDTQKETHDLQMQVDLADKKLRETVQFLELQATERETERDETQRQLTTLQAQLAQRERECAASEQISQEIEQLEQRMRDMTQLMEESEQKKQETETELKEAIDKIYVLRDIIRDLENQVEVRTISELKLQTQIEDLQNAIKQQCRNNEQLTQELDSLKLLPDNQQLIKHAEHLEKELAEFKQFSSSVDELQQMKDQLEELETVMYKKAKDLENIHQMDTAAVCFSPSEDVSAAEVNKERRQRSNSVDGGGDNGQKQFEPMEMIRRLQNALNKHSRVETATVKRIKDLEMQITSLNQKYQDLQVERDVLQDRLSDQLTEISTLQMRLDEQRHLVQTITKQSSISLENEIFELKNENRDLKERLNAQDKQLKHLNTILEKTSQQLKCTEKDLQISTNHNKDIERQMDIELKSLTEENKMLKEQLDKDSESRKVVPDIMETLLADRDAEIELLKNKLEEKTQSNDSKNSARTLSDVVSISEYDDVDVLRKHADNSTRQNSLAIQSETSRKTVHFDDDEAVQKLQNQLSAKQKELDDFKQMLHSLEVNYEVNVHQTDLIRSELEQKAELNFKLQKDLDNQLEKLQEQQHKIQSLEAQVTAKTCEIENLNQNAQMFHENFLQLNKQIKDNEGVLAKKTNQIDELHKEIVHLQDYLKEKDKIIQNITEDSQHLRQALETIQNKMKETGNVIDLMKKLKDEQLLTSQLREEIVLIKAHIDRLEDTHGENTKSKDYNELEMISDQVQEQLNQSVQLDTKILSALEENSKTVALTSTPRHRLQKVENFNIEVPPNPELAKLEAEKESLSEHLRNLTSCNQELAYLRDSLIEQLDEVRKQLNLEKENCKRLQALLDDEKAASNEIQEEDADLMEQLHSRLKTALDNEIQLENTIEREKQIRNELNEQLMVLQNKLESTMKEMEANRNNTDQIEQLNTVLVQKQQEVDQLKVQLEHQLKQNKFTVDEMHKMDQIVAENVQLKIEKSEMKNRLNDLSAKLNRNNMLLKANKDEWHKIYSATSNDNNQQQELVEARLVQMKQGSAEKLDQARRLIELEQENKLIQLQVSELKRDLKFAHDQENRLTEMLAKERDQQLKSPIPAKFLEKINDLKQLLDTHVRENRQMSETVKKLTDERHMLQDRIKYLEQQCNDQENDNRFNTIFARFLRVDSYRKALAWQKQYLLAVVYSYEQNNIDHPLLPPSIHTARKFRKQREKPKFKIISVMLIAILRMKFMVRRWSTGIRLNARSLNQRSGNNNNINTQTHLSSQNIQQGCQTRLFDEHNSSENVQRVAPIIRPYQLSPQQQQPPPASWSGETPPCRDYSSSRPVQSYPQSLQAPLLINQYMERFDQIQQRLGLLSTQIPSSSNTATRPSS